MKWRKETPSREGWYWIKYKNKRGVHTIVPCSVAHIDNRGTVVMTARYDMFMAHHPSTQLCYDGKPDKSIRFGDYIPHPSEEEKD